MRILCKWTWILACKPSGAKYVSASAYIYTFLLSTQISEGLKSFSSASTAPCFHFFYSLKCAFIVSKYITNNRALWICIIDGANIFSQSYHTFPVFFYELKRKLGVDFNWRKIKRKMYFSCTVVCPHTNTSNLHARGGYIHSFILF